VVRKRWELVVVSSSSSSRAHMPVEKVGKYVAARRRRRRRRGIILDSYARALQYQIQTRAGAFWDESSMDFFLSFARVRMAGQPR